MNGIMNIGLQGLSAFQAALQYTGENIANENTPNYTRRQVNFAETLAGEGVTIASVQRIFDDSANENVLNTSSNLSSMTLNLQRLKYFEGIVDAKSSPVLSSMNNALKSLQALDGQANSTDKRLQYLNQLQVLSQQVATVNSQISQEQTNINSTLVTDAVTMNNILTSLSGINLQLASATGDAQNALLDQQSGLLSQMATFVNFSTATNADGSVNLFMQNGTSLLLGQQVYSFGTMNDPADAANTVLFINANTVQVQVDNIITSGSVGGLLNYRNTVEQTSQSLGQFVLAVSQTFNAQNALGLDLNGNLGGDIFNDINANAVLASGRAIANNANTGTEGITSMNVNIDSVNALTGSNYTLSFTSPTQYQLMRQSDGQTITGTLSGTFPQSITSPDGYTINLTSGGYAAGDSFLISPTRGATQNFGLAISDPKLFALASPVAVTVPLTNTGSGQLKSILVTDTTTSAFSNLTGTPPTYSLNPPVTIQFTAANTYSIIDTTNGTTIQSGIPYTPGTPVIPSSGYTPGYSIMLQGVPAAGDTFLIDYNPDRNDNKNGLAMENLYTATTVMSNGTTSFTSAYTSLANNVSETASNTNALYSSAKTLNDAAVAQQAQISGVSTSEETANLAMYQQSFQACAQVLQASKSIFESFLSVMGGR